MHAAKKQERLTRERKLYFVTAIGTDSGKTLASAILCEALGADYWKPVQAGLPTDADAVRNLVTNPAVVIHAEAFRLMTPESPHAAARREGLNISVRDFTLPPTNNSIVIEGAGGCLVPINDQELIIDLASHFNAAVILVSNFYLGSINHTLLTIEALKRRSLNVSGIIFNGPRNEESERIIMNYAGFPCLLHIGAEAAITKEIVKKYAGKLSTGIL